MADGVATATAKQQKMHPQTIAERVFERLQATYPKIRSAKGELIKDEDGSNERWRFEIVGPARIKDGEIVGHYSSECTFPVGTLEAKIYGSFLGWCDIYKIKLGMKIKKLKGEEEEDEAA